MSRVVSPVTIYVEHPSGTTPNCFVATYGRLICRDQQISLQSPPSAANYQGIHDLLDVSAGVLYPLYAFLLAVGVIRAMFYRL